MRRTSGDGSNAKASRRYLFLTALVLVAAPALAPGARARQEAPGVAPPRAQLHSERLSLASGAELITIFGAGDAATRVPLVAVLDDTLGDADPSNDRLRYVWVFAYSPPSLRQRLLSAVPFFYRGASTREAKPATAPPVIYDFSRNPDSLWRTVLWYAAQAAVFDPRGWLFSAGSRTYERNERERRETHLRNGLSVLSAYRGVDADAPELLNDDTFAQVYERIVGGGLAGVFLTDRHVADAYERDAAASRRAIARNWELLRQRCEEEGLVFDPLPAPPARARHAIVWVERDAVAASPPGREFDARFLNVKSPWADADLRSWGGYSATFFVDADGRYARDASPGAREVEMIPLAVYGLDFPRIPALLVDFRSVLNPKRREVSRRAIDDFGRILGASPVGGLKYQVVQKVYDIVTRRKGMDVGQPTRALAYAQLKSLLVLDDQLDPGLREILERDLERFNVNPLENDVDAERRLARTQYAALLEQVRRGALDRRVERDRGREMVALAHGKTARVLLKALEVATLGAWSHRDEAPELRERYAVARSLERHRARLARVASAPPPIEVTWAPESYRDALEFVASHGATDATVARSLERIFANSGDAATRFLALDALRRVDTEASLAALARIARDDGVPPALRAHSALLLESAPGDAPPPGHAATIFVNPLLLP